MSDYLTTGTNQRFVLNEKVTDLLNPANSVKYYHTDDGAPADDRHLREWILRKRLSDLFDKLIIDLKPMQKHPSGEYQPFNDARYEIWCTVFLAIKTSHLNSFDPALSIQHRFGGALKREKKGMRDFTSLSLFIGDLECLLRDLYGDIEGEALDSVLDATLSIVKAFTKYARADIAKEFSDAADLDYMLGIGVPEGYGLSGSEWRDGMRAKFDLIVRAYEVLAGPSAFSKYTVEFAKHFSEHWIVPNNDAEMEQLKLSWFKEPE